MERQLTQPRWGVGNTLVLSQQDDGTDLVDALEETLPSLWSRWSGMGEGGENGRRGERGNMDWNVKK